jgi:hypothetical protein
MATTRKPRVTQELKTVVIPPSSEEGVAAVEVLNELIKDKAEAKAKATKQTATINLQSTDIPPAGIPVSAPQTVTMTVQDVQAMIQQAADAAAIAAKAQLTTAVQAIEEDESKSPEMEKLKKQVADLQASLKQTQDEKHQQEQAMDNLQAVTGITGRSQNYNADTLNVFTSRTDHQSYLVKQAFEAIQSAPRHTKNYEGLMWTQPDSGVVDDLVANHITEAKAKYRQPFITVKEFAALPLVQELTEWGKRQGLFKGPGGSADRAINAGVVMDDMVGGFLPLLSSMLRYTHRGGYIFWQFPDVAIDHGRNRGDTIQIARYALNAEPANDSDWLLSGGGTWADLTTNSQGTETGVVDAVIKEYGMGKDTINANRPYVVPNFVQMYSALSVLESFNVNLMRNYMQFEDRYIRGLWTPTSRVVYNNGDTIETTVGNITTGSGGQFTLDFLYALELQMKTEYIPTFADNCYGLALNTIQWNQLRRSVLRFDANAFVNPQNAVDLLGLVNLLPALSDTDRVSGYKGRWGNFHVFEQNTFAMGAAGTSGVQNVTTGVGSKLCRTAYAFGANTIGRGIGLPMEIRTQNGEIRWNRDQRFIWISHESFAALDVDPTGYSDTDDVPQQSRVFQVRTFDTEL